MSTIPAEELHALVAEIFRAHGVPDSDAAIVAASLVHANLRGTDSHGVMRVPHYVKRLRAGSICPAPQETFTQTGPCTGMLGGGDGLGHVNALHAMHEAVRMARESGLALVAVRNSSHCGALSFLVQPALEAGLIGIALTQTDAGTLPYGGVKPFFGTNPLCYAFPSARACR